jgi:ribosomal 50S subunit-associated protein YjgA (DUF615 family)
MSSNPMLAELDRQIQPNQNTTNQEMGQMQQAINLVKGSDPSSIVQNLASNNPQMNQALTLLQAMNGNIEQAVRNMALAQGKDINQMISEFHQCMGQ